MNFFKRLFKIGEAEANAALNNIEDPIKLTEQGIQDMKGDLNKNLEAVAQVKSLVIRAENEKEEYQAKAKDYEEKAMLILKKAYNGDITNEKADILAKEALTLKEDNLKLANTSQLDAEKFKKSANQLDHNIQNIKKNINKWENELKTLKARIKVTKATKNLNKQMAKIDESSTVAMLERMKDKVNQEEALAEAYGDIANSNKKIEDEINDVLNNPKDTIDNNLAELKKQLGLNKK